MPSSPELPATKRKRTAKPHPSSPSLTFAASNAPIVSFGSSALQALASATGATEAAPRPPPRSPRSPGGNSFHWSFLSHPVLKHLRKWPGLASSSSSSSTASVAVAATAPAPQHDHDPASVSPSSSSPPLTASNDVSLKFARLLSIPPIASSIASGLYGRDLLSLRVLNRTFHDVLSTQVSNDGQRPYYHTLLLKSLLCTRVDVTTEPIGIACKGAGGNVGPCMLCATPICSVCSSLATVISSHRKETNLQRQTCVYPEIWTIRRYRYLCPGCCSSANSKACACQSNIWMCRPCYKTHWIEDLDYDTAGQWIDPTASATCHRCKGTQTVKSDSRLPSLPGRRTFRGWFVDPTGKKRRPVSCGWCAGRVDPKVEDWTLRPLAIKRGEERGRNWIREMERRRKEREGETDSNDPEGRD